jgi:hypothetical protein
MSLMVLVKDRLTLIMMVHCIAHMNGRYGNEYDIGPIRVNGVHLSAPHIYGLVLESLELAVGCSFLNIGYYSLTLYHYII